jgi:hypothetical protein
MKYMIDQHKSKVQKHNCLQIHASGVLQAQIETSQGNRKEMYYGKDQ